MGYDETEVFWGKHHDGQDVIAGFRFVVPLAQGTQLTSGSLSVWLEEKYPEGLAVWDKFTDDDGTLLTAHTIAPIGPAAGWFQYNGSITIQSNQAYTTTDAIYVLDGDVADGTVKVSVIGFVGSGAYGGLVFRFSDSSNYWRFVAVNGLNDYYLIKVVGGNSTTVASNLDGGDPSGLSYKVVLDGDSIKCYRADGLYFDVTDADLNSNTRHGLYADPNQANDLVLWDNFEFIPAGTSGSISFGVSCEDVNNSADFQTGGLPDTRTLTTGYRSLGDISGWNKDDWNTTVDIKIPIQEVLDRPGWVSGNHLSVMVIPSIVEADCKDGERFRVESYDGQANRAAKLALSW